MSTSAIATKLVEAMKSIDAVEKRGRNQQQGYNFVKSADVANEVRLALASQGIAFSYSVVSERFWDSTTKSGNIQFFCSLLINVTFTDSASGESISCQSIGWGADSQEKAPYKAMTGALKYALRMNFLIPDESDPEEGHVHESVAAPRQQPQQRAGTRGGGGTITEPQAKRFWALAKRGEKTADDVRRYLMDVCKVEKTAQMPKSMYEAACKWAEEPLPAPESHDDYAQPENGKYFEDGTYITDADLPEEMFK